MSPARLFPPSFRLPSLQVIQDLNQARWVFLRHPLYRYWGKRAYQGAGARWVEGTLEWVANTLPSLLLLVPFLFTGVCFLFGTAPLWWLILALLGLGIGVLLCIAGLTLFLPLALARLGLQKERQSGDWDLLLMTPLPRAQILHLFLSSSLYVYRDLLFLLGWTQNLCGLLLMLGLLGFSNEANTSLGQTNAWCFLFIWPCFFCLNFERRQDFALGVALGTFSALRGDMWGGLSGALLSLMFRAALGLLSLLWLGSGQGVANLLPTLIGGAGVLPLLAWQAPAWLGMMSYFIAREALIAALWRGAASRLGG